MLHNGFRSTAGSLAVLGLHGLPLWLYTTRYVIPLDDSNFEWLCVTSFLIAGRILAAMVELAFIHRHIWTLVHAQQNLSE